MDSCQTQPYHFAHHSAAQTASSAPLCKADPCKSPPYKAAYHIPWPQKRPSILPGPHFPLRIKCSPYPNTIKPQLFARFPFFARKSERSCNHSRSFLPAPAPVRKTNPFVHTAAADLNSVDTQSYNLGKRAANSARVASISDCCTTEAPEWI